MIKGSKKAIEDLKWNASTSFPVYIGVIPKFKGKVGDTFLKNTEKTTQIVRFTITHIGNCFFRAVTDKGTVEDFLRVDVQIGEIKLKEGAK